MALPIITAVRARHDLKESVFHTLIELAHRSSIYGVVRVSNAYMGEKCHCSARTFQRHVVKLEAEHILRKTVTKKLVKVKVGDRMETRLRNEINTYTFIIPWKKPSSSTLPIDRMSTTLPHPEGEKKAALREEGGNSREKTGSLREELANAQKVLGDCTPGSIFWQWSHENITRLEGLLAASALSATG